MSLLNVKTLFSVSNFPVTPSKWTHLAYSCLDLIFVLFPYLKTVKSDSRFSQLAVMFTYRCFLFLPRLFTVVSLLYQDEVLHKHLKQLKTPEMYVYRNNFKKPLIGNLSQQLFHGKE